MTDDLKQCPYCGETINLSAIKCKYCKSWLTEEAEEKETYRKCPFCHEPVPKYAEKCSSCGEWLQDEQVNSSVGLWLGNKVVQVICKIWIVIGLIVGVIFSLSLALDSGVDNSLFAGIGAFLSGILISLIFVIFLFFGTYLFMFPSIYAFSKNHPQFMPILIINILFGETVFGWIVAMIWANIHRMGRHTHW